MDLATAGLHTQPFRTHGRPLCFVSSQGQADAGDFLRRCYEHPRGLGILQGPPLSGKTTLLKHFIESLDEDAGVALVDGHAITPQQLLEQVLEQFGFNVKFDSLNEMTNMLRVYALQQVGAYHAPLLVIENTHDLRPDILQLLCTLAEWQVRGQNAVRMVLASNRCITPILRSPAMVCIGRRLTGVFNLCPMEDYETLAYLHAKLDAAGCQDAAAILPEKVCHALHAASGGWPGIVDRLVLLALARARSLPLRKKHIEKTMIPPMTGDGGLQAVDNLAASQGAPRLFLTYSGKTIKEIPFDRTRIMVGRSEHNDLPIVSRFISRHHAMFIRDGDTTVLMDLNSTNGTFVNSKRISNHVMMHDDVVSIGHHGLKFVDHGARESRSLSGDSFSDTIIMKSLDDLRRLLARDNTQSIDLDAAGDAGDRSG